MKNQPRTLADYLALPYRLEIIPDDGEYFVHYPDLPGCMTQVERLDDAIPMAREILEGWLELALEDGDDIPLPREPETYSGKFVVRLTKSLHRRLAESSEREDVSLNTYVATLLDRNDALARLECRLDELSRQIGAHATQPANGASETPGNNQQTEPAVSGTQVKSSGRRR